MTIIVEMADDCDITSQTKCLLCTLKTMKQSIIEEYNSFMKDAQYM